MQKTFNICFLGLQGNINYAREEEKITKMFQKFGLKKFHVVVSFKRLRLLHVTCTMYIKYIMLVNKY